jgi:hypothetical protein
MAIEVAGTGHTLLWYALAQNDVDMQNHKLLNLDTSNLQQLGKPPTFVAPPHQWIRSWDNPTNAWGASQPNFNDLAGQLTLGVNGQQRHITELGTIGVGTWQGSIIAGTYLARLDQIRQPGADVNMASKRLINLANPINAQDAVTKSFMDYLLQGLNPKTAVRLASTSTHGHVGLHGVDGVVPRDGDRILLKDQVGREAENTIWIARTGPWDVAPDMDTFDEVNRAYCTVREGNVNAGMSFVQVSPQTAQGQVKSWILFAVLGSGQGDPGPPGPGVPAGGATDAILAKNSPADYDTKWVVVPGITQPTYAVLQTGQLNPTGTSNATGRMMGLAGILTLITSGKFVATINGFLWNNNAAGAVVCGMRLGSGAAPHNGDPIPAGSIPIGGASALSRMPANGIAPFSLSCVIGGVQTGVPVWIDLLVQCPSGIGVASVGAVSIDAYEIP